MVERYQMVACIGLRKSESDGMVTVPLYIKIRAEEGNPLPVEQEDLICQCTYALKTFHNNK